MEGIVEDTTEERKLVYQEIYITPRKTEIRARRQADAKMDDFLSDGMKRAANEINKYFSLITSGLMTGQINPDRVDGNSTADWSADTILALKDYKSWAKSQPRLHYAITLDVCVFGFTARQTAEQRGKSPTTVMKYLRESLNDYCISRGWGSEQFDRT